jgi:hypothetical protein
LDTKSFVRTPIALVILGKSASCLVLLLLSYIAVAWCMYNIFSMKVGVNILLRSFPVGVLGSGESAVLLGGEGRLGLWDWLTSIGCGFRF